MTSRLVPHTKFELIISPAARDDLISIYQTSVDHWGSAQANRYQDLIKKHFLNLTEHPLLGMERPDLMAAVRSLPLEHHTLFYRIHSQTVEVIRLLHGRQDAKTHLGKHREY